MILLLEESEDVKDQEIFAFLYLAMGVFNIFYFNWVVTEGKNN